MFDKELLQGSASSVLEADEDALGVVLDEHRDGRVELVCGSRALVVEEFDARAGEREDGRLA